MKALGKNWNGDMAKAKKADSVLEQRTHPLSDVRWVDPTTLHANDYNPNNVFPVEMRLLKTSILEDGWTQPIVARTDGEIVDGFHRWTLGSTDADIQAISGGLVPVVRINDDRSKADQRMSTIRHNRARGSHHVVKMADIVCTLINDEGVSEEEVQKRLGMDEEEVIRLLDHGNMLRRGAAEKFSKAWVPSYDRGLKND